MSGTTTPTYIDTGWSGTPTALSAALTALGFQVNADNTVSTIDPTKNTVGIVAVAGYQVLDGTAYVLLRSTAALSTPAGVTVVGPQTTAVFSGVFMPDGSQRPTTIPAGVFFGRFTPTETAAIWAAAVANPAIGVGLMQGLALGTIDLTNPTLIAWVGGLVTAGIINTTRQTTVLTP